MTIQKAVVLGSGTMGKQIAGHLLNAGLDVRLIKITDDLTSDGLAKLKKDIQPFLYQADDIQRLEIKAWEEWLLDEEAPDIVLEAIVEDLDSKQELWRKVEDHCQHPSTLFVSNTSSLSIEAISQGLKNPKRLLGLHFFMPVPSSRLVEIVSYDPSQDQQVKQLQDFVLNKLGKNYIVAKDEIGFIANRIGFYANHDIMQRAEEKSWPVSQVDALSGKYLGRTKMGPYRLSDFTGNDLSLQAIKNYQADSFLNPFFKERPVAEQMVDQGLLGDKVKAGYYKKENKKRYVLNLESFTYEAGDFPYYGFFDDFKSQDFSHNFQLIFDAQHELGKFMWESLSQLLYFSAVNVGIVTDDYRDIDRAMVWGYNWSLGPFQIWDAIGFDQVKERLAEEHGELPAWLDSIEHSFYQKGESIDLTPSLKDQGYEELDQSFEQGCLYSKDRILLFLIASKNNTLNIPLFKEMLATLDLLEQEEYEGLILSTAGKNFSVGYDLKAMQEQVEKGQIDKHLEESSTYGYELVNRIKYSRKPIVTAIRSYTLGGGAEIAMQSPMVIAAAQSYIGLTEVGVGLIPSGGGLAELADRVYRSKLSRYEKKRRLQDAFMTVAYGKVSKDAYDAKRLGYLKDTDQVVLHEGQLIPAAEAWIRFQWQIGFHPLAKKSYPVFGTEFKAMIEGLTSNWVQAGFASEYDQQLARCMADVLAGGNLAMGMESHPDLLQKLEIQHFKDLSREEKTYQRMKHMMTTGRVLHN